MADSGIFPTDDWTLSRGTMNGDFLMVRARSGMPAEVDRTLFSTLMVVKWAFDADVNGGMPTSAISNEMEQFEDRIATCSDHDRWWGSCVAVITTPGLREWRFYTPDSRNFIREFSHALSGLGPYPLEITEFADEDWIALAELRN